MALYMWLIGMKNTLHQINKASKLFVIYFPVILVAGQVLINLMSFVAYDWYIAMAFWLNLSFGTNILISLFLLRWTFMLRMCAVSRWAAGAECLFAINYAIVQVDSVYNIMFQVIVGVLSLIATFWHYIKKFPDCNFSVGLHFLANAVRHCSCQKSLDKFDEKVTRAYHEKRRL